MSKFFSGSLFAVTMFVPAAANAQTRSTAVDTRLAQCEDELTDARRQLNECRAQRVPVVLQRPPTLHRLLPVIVGTGARCPAGTAIRSFRFQPRNVQTEAGYQTGVNVVVSCIQVMAGGATLSGAEDDLRRQMQTFASRLTALEAQEAELRSALMILTGRLSSQSGPESQNLQRRARDLHEELERITAMLTRAMAGGNGISAEMLAEIDSRIVALRREQDALTHRVDELEARVGRLEVRVGNLENRGGNGSFAERIDVRPFVSGGVMIPLEARLGGVTPFAGAGACVDVGVNADRSVQVNACGGGGGGFNAAAGNAIGYGEYGLGMTYLARGSAVGFRAGFQGRHFATSPERFANVAQDTGGRGFSLNGRAEVLFRAGRLQIGVGAEVGGLLNTFSARTTANGGREVTHQGSTPVITPTVTLSIPILDRF